MTQYLARIRSGPTAPPIAFLLRHLGAAELSEAGKCLGNGRAAAFKRRSERGGQCVATIGLLDQRESLGYHLGRVAAIAGREDDRQLGAAPQWRPKPDPHAGPEVRPVARADGRGRSRCGGPGQ